MDKKEAISAINSGVILACVQAVAATIIVLFAITNNLTEGFFSRYNDPFFFFDVIVIVVCAYILHRKKYRFVAVILFFNILLNIIWLMLHFGTFNIFQFGILSVGLISFFLYYYARAVQGTFVLHKIGKIENPDYKKTSKLLYFIGIPVGIILLFLMTLGVLEESGNIPPMEVQSSKTIHPKFINTLITNGITSKDEKIEFFYSTGFFSILEEGSILTDKHLIIYVTNEFGELDIWRIPLDKIQSLDQLSEGGFLDFSMYEVITNDNDGYNFYLSGDNEEDKKFISALRARSENCLFCYD